MKNKSCFIDAHCHVDFYDDTKIEKIIENARESQVNIIINNGVNPETNRKTLALSSKYPEIKSALGLYPIDALKFSDKEIALELDFIEKNEDKIAAIGEVGLDFKEDIKSWEKQKQTLSKLVSLAIKLNKPVIIHSRKAELECIELLEKLETKKVIMHCFSGKLSLVKRIISNGWFLTIPTNVVSSEHFQNVVSLVPVEQLLCETDSPYLHPFKERDNKPQFVVESYKKIAQIKNISLEKVKEQIYNNYLKLFNN